MKSFENEDGMLNVDVFRDVGINGSVRLGSSMRDQTTEWNESNKQSMVVGSINQEN